LNFDCCDHYCYCGS